ncbi:MAG TPA: non-canonical purine NTP pyrophosphatase, partial [Candidatus Limnocylindrales bacterium]|nr:non-canonical purine NTP pyrophosphatase [Candidatus Limnocylindrales bacterium]
MTLRLLVGSGNPGKVAEYRRLLAGLDVALVSPGELDPVPAEPGEDATTFAENAAAKARAYAGATGITTVADDSGLEVDALRGAPGVRSRRFFGEEAAPAERNARLLALL